MLMDSSANHPLPLLRGVELVEGGNGSVSCSAFMEPENIGRCGPAARAAAPSGLTPASVSLQLDWYRLDPPPRSGSLNHCCGPGQHLRPCWALVFQAVLDEDSWCSVQVPDLLIPLL